jgi:hypothetical protein
MNNSDQLDTSCHQQAGKSSHGRLITGFSAQVSIIEQHSPEKKKHNGFDQVAGPELWKFIFFIMGLYKWAMDSC